MSGALRVVVITNYTYAGAKVLDGLYEEGIDVVGVVMQRRKRSAIAIAGLVRDRLVQLLRGVGAHRKAHYPLHVVGKINSEEGVRTLTRLRPDVIAVVGGPILKKDVIRVPTRAIVNFHTSILPRYRGLDTEFWALYHDDPEHVGVSVHFLNERIDDGNIIVQQRTPCTMRESPYRLKLMNIDHNYRLMAQAIRMLEDEKLTGTRQDASQGSYFSAPTREQRRELKARLRRRRR